MRDHALVLSAQLTYSLLRFAAFVLLARSLTKDEMGQAMFGLNYTLIFTLLGTLGLDSAYTYFTAQFQLEHSNERLHRLFSHAIWVASIWGTALSVVGVILCLYSFQLLSFQEAIIFMLSVPVALMQMYGLGILLGLHDLVSYNILFIIQPFSFILFLLVLAGIDKLYILEIALALVISYIISAFGVLWKIIRRIPMIWDNQRFNLEELRDQIKFSSFVYVNLISLFLDSRWPILVMGWLNHTEQIAYYSLAAPIAEASLQIARSVGLVLLARTSAGQQPSHTPVIAIVLLYIPAIALLVVLAPWVVPHLFGNEYMPTTLLIQVLAPSMIPLAVGTLYTNMLTGIGHPWLGALAAVASLGVMILTSALLIPLYSAVGAAIASGLAYLTYGASTFMLGRKVLPKQQMVKHL